MEEKVREIFNSHESEDVKIKRLAALMDGCYGCSARVTSCTQFEVGAPCLRTPTEPKE